MHHLAVCPQLYEKFWSHILDYADDLNLQTPREGESIAMYLILGCIRKEGEWAVVDPAKAGVLAIGWRCLYAEITNVRIHNSQINLRRALARVFQLTIA